MAQIRKTIIALAAFVMVSLAVAAISVSIGKYALAKPPASKKKPKPAPVPAEVPPKPKNETACCYQDPNPDLMRENFLARHFHDKEERAKRKAMQAAAIEYRTRHYGYFEGFGKKAWNDKTPLENAIKTEFMGRPIRINQRIVPVLACVEEQIKSECGDEYKPQRLSGIRTKNTYHNGQASNHIYGIAVDVDPTKNTCCLCVGKWREHKLCEKEVESIYDRMAMPECWVHVFERFGFYWLGRDRMQDTMHFEFLGDPEIILKSDHKKKAAEKPKNTDDKKPPAKTETGAKQ